ncbi:hypothetical protein NAI48_10190, partial [Francisella tularensis subsp. holarctica]|uniref:hypothetical protein n=1 Tax=Francisella tularensis TaxID=263 RepID=UPI002381AC4E
RVSCYIKVHDSFVLLFYMKKCCILLVNAGLLMSLNSCIWLAVAGIGAAGGATGAYGVEKK